MCEMDLNLYSNVSDEMLMLHHRFSLNPHQGTNVLSSMTLHSLSVLWGVFETSQGVPPYKMASAVSLMRNNDNVLMYFVFAIFYWSI